MLKLEKPQDLLQHVGKELGPSEWLTVTQEMIDKFADATGDHQWIHVDAERARRWRTSRVCLPPSPWKRSQRRCPLRASCG